MSPHNDQAIPVVLVCWKSILNNH